MSWKEMTSESRPTATKTTTAKTPAAALAHLAAATKRAATRTPSASATTKPIARSGGRGDASAPSTVASGFGIVDVRSNAGRSPRRSASPHETYAQAPGLAAGGHASVRQRKVPAAIPPRTRAAANAA
ncbi:MAG TPA: hypothetical protein VE693_05540 [Gaiellaceae bacterium]|nr:hypothetical protein [Gaiellaceae bacterium]